MKNRAGKNTSGGFTLLEVLFASAIMAACISGLLLTYINLLTLTDLTRFFTVATNAASRKIEEIKRLPYGTIADYNNTTFNVADFYPPEDAIGRVEVANTTNTTGAFLKRIRVVVCFRTRGRVIGEDKNLNGALDSGESPDSRLDSPVEIVTYVANFTM